MDIMAGKNVQPRQKVYRKYIGSTGSTQEETSIAHRKQGLNASLLHSVYLYPVLLHQRVETPSVKSTFVCTRLKDLIKINTSL